MRLALGIDVGWSTRRRTCASISHISQRWRGIFRRSDALSQKSTGRMVIPTKALTERCDAK